VALLPAAATERRDMLSFREAELQCAQRTACPVPFCCVTGRRACQALASHSSMRGQGMRTLRIPTSVNGIRFCYQSDSKDVSERAATLHSIARSSHSFSPAGLTACALPLHGCQWLL
jgi:hypothetical protein